MSTLEQAIQTLQAKAKEAFEQYFTGLRTREVIRADDEPEYVTCHEIEVNTIQICRIQFEICCFQQFNKEPPQETVWAAVFTYDPGHPNDLNFEHQDDETERLA